ncbi:hypothetical protein ACJJTC_000069 [Scirpophaga incertulas]
MDSDTSEDEEVVKSFEDQSSAREEQITLDISTGTEEEIQKDDKENCNYRTEENILVLENTYQGCENNTEENISSSEQTDPLSWINSSDSVLTSSEHIYVVQSSLVSHLDLNSPVIAMVFLLKLTWRRLDVYVQSTVPVASQRGLIVP